MPASRRHSDDAVTEVVGQILIFGILSVVLTMSLVSFNVAKHSAEERILASTADAYAQQVADLVIDTAVMTAQFQGSDIDVQAIVDLPDVIQNRPYTVDLDQDAVVFVVDRTTTRQAPLFAAHSVGTVHVCDQSPFVGETMALWVVDQARMDVIKPGGTTPDPNVSCDTYAGSSYYLFLYP